MKQVNNSNTQSKIKHEIKKKPVCQETDYSKYFEELEALTNYNEHLNFITNLLEKIGINNKEKEKLTKQIENLKQRSSDPNFYLAIVGEFSSGKSTLINAILEDDLLKSSVIQGTTATATQIKSGKYLTIKAKLNAKTIKNINTHPNSKNITIRQIPEIKNVNVKQLIHLLTTHEQIAPKVTSLIVNHPATFLQEGITIIDTPGTNALKVEHGEITKKVIENEADATLIIIPATTPLSQTLANFLETSLHPFLHRCIFVVTKIDKIRKREQESLIDNLKVRLKEMLGLENPLILPAAPQIILDEITGEEEIPSKLLIWKDKFLELKNTIIAKLKQERILIISENLLHLLTEILEQLEQNLNQEWQTYKQRQLALENETIQDLTSFTLKQQQKCRQKIEQAIEKTKNQTGYCITEHQEKAKQKIRQKIMAVSNWEQLNNVTQNGAETALTSGQKALQSELQRKLIIIDLSAKEAQEFFDQEFAQAYQKLQTLGSNFNFFNNLSNQSLSMNISNVFSDMKSLQAQEEGKAVNRVINGAVIGIISGILFPGIGLLLGGVAGAFLSRLFGPSLEERKNELWNKLEPSLNSYFQQLKKQVNEDIRNYGRTLIKALESHVNLYMGKYKDVVDLMLNEQQLELNRLNNLQETTQNYLKEIEIRKNKIKQQQERLAKTNGR
jgi:predicted GTPase